MRLVRLSMQGFGAFRDATELDFTDADFFALVGPTGAGKSTVIDAVCFALYGAVPRYEDQRMNRYVLTLGSSEARVSLTFELGEDNYVATRIVRRNAKGQFSTKEARLERLEETGPSTVLAGAEREMNPAVESLLRLNFEDFTRCVALPQGEFARFLRAKGEERRELLLRLLNLNVYLSVGQRAGQVAAVAKAGVELRRQQLEDLADATPEALSLATKRSSCLKKLNDRARKVRPEVDEHIRLEAEERRSSADARSYVQLLQRIAVPDKARKHGVLLAESQKDLLGAEEAAKAATQVREAATVATKGLPDVFALKTAAVAHDGLTRCTVRLVTTQADVANAETSEAQAEEKLAQAETLCQKAESELQEVETAHTAEHLAEKLVVGEVCPVCDQVVRSIPSRHVPKALSKAKKAEADAKKQLLAARTAQSTAAKAVAALDGIVAAVRLQHAGLELQIKAYPDLDALNELIATTEDNLAMLSGARDKEDAANESRATKQHDLNAMATVTETLQAAFDSQRDSVARLGPPPAQRRDLIADWEVLSKWAEASVTEQQSAATAAGERADAHRLAAGAQIEVLIAECAELDLSVRGDIVNVLTALTEAATRAAAEVQRITDALADAKTFGDEIKGFSEDAEVASALRGLLRADRFPEWLLSEALELLVTDASGTLRSLTNDGFSLTLGEKEFMVIDHANADEHRSARTLSGGETFQASLALALALSDQIRSLAADGSPRLDALFLDEGFGTLDSETLETVAATIENLGQSGRMVGIITHVRELAARVPVRFEVRKGPRTSTVERQTS